MFGKIKGNLPNIGKMRFDCKNAEKPRAKSAKFAKGRNIEKQ